MSDEVRLQEKLRAIEALLAGATTTGEQAAAGRARQRIMERIARLERETPVEWEFTKLDPWSQRLFIALAKRYGLKPYRYRRQRKSTLIVKAPKSFLDDVFVPAFNRMGETHLTEVAERVIAEVLEHDVPEDEPPRQLEAFSTNAL